MSNPDGSNCPKCQKTNPVGAKFCSGCSASLVTTPPPPAPNPMPPPPPPPRPMGGAMMGRFGGKSETRQFEAEAETLFAATVQFVEGCEGSEIKHHAAPHQISANLIFKDMMTTLNAPIKVDSEIQITPSAPGQCSIAINAKVDWSSTTSVWLITIAVLVVVVMLNPMFFFILLFLGVIGTGFNIWMLSNRAPAKVADDLFAYLRQHVGTATEIPSTAPAVAVRSTTVSGVPPQKPADQSTAGQVPAEEEPMERIKKLAELKELGAITVEEFEEKKAELLKRI